MDMDSEHAANTQRGVDTPQPPPSFDSGSTETESTEDEDFDGFGNQGNERPHHHHHHPVTTTHHKPLLLLVVGPLVKIDDFEDGDLVQLLRLGICGLGT